MFFVVGRICYIIGKSVGGQLVRAQTKQIESKPQELDWQCAHVWGKWTATNINLVNATGRNVSTLTGQNRECDICGLIQTRKMDLS